MLYIHMLNFNFNEGKAIAYTPECDMCLSSPLQYVTPQNVFLHLTA